jgi:hypothetical protein
MEKPFALANSSHAGLDWEALMNHSIYSADRSTHLKIVVLALLAAIAVTSLSLSLHSSPAEPSDKTAVLRAGKPVAISSSAVGVVR